MNGLRASQIIVCTNAQSIAEKAARRLIDKVEDKRRAAVCLSGGSTPLRLYTLLAEEPLRSSIPWKNIDWFWGDERFVPEDDPRSNWGAAKRTLFEHAPVPHDKIHPIPTGLGSIEASALAYEQELQTYYGSSTLNSTRPLFDLVLLGIGRDGHIASLFPGQTALGVTDRWAIGIPEAGQEPFVPRVTLTFPALTSSREILMLVAGEDKRPVIKRLLEGDNLPAARIGSGGNVTWLIDQTAMPYGS